MSRRWLITGCASGLGLALAEAAAAAGDRVIATDLREDALAPLAARYPGNISTTALDVTDADACTAAARFATATYGGVDVLVNNAGFGQFGAVEEVGDDQLRAEFETNVFGPWRMVRAFLPLMRAQGSGQILMVSSAAGGIVYPGLGAYAASKYALEGMAETLAAEVAGFGIAVCILEPGGFATHFGSATHQPEHQIEAYTPIVGAMRDALTAPPADNPAVEKPAAFAATVLELVNSGHHPMRMPIGTGVAEQLLEAWDRRRTDMLEAHRHGTAVRVS